MLADLTSRSSFGDTVQLTSVTSYINRDILVSRDASALTGSVSVDLGYPTAAVTLPSNLRDTTDLETLTQELRSARPARARCNGWSAGSIRDIDRVYRQRLPTPGYDAFTDATLGAGTAAATANGFPANSPYNADLPYNIEQFAVFGEAELRPDRPPQGDGRRALLRLQGRRAGSCRAAVLQRRQPFGRDELGRLLAALHPELRS